MIRNHLAKLTEDTVEEIYIELRGTATNGEIARMFGVSAGLIGHINSGRAWAVPGVTYPIRRKEKKIEINYDGDLSHSYPLEDHYSCHPYEDRWSYK